MTTTSSTLSAVVHQMRLEARQVLSLELRPADAAQPFVPAAAGSHIDLHLAPGLVRSYSLVHAGEAGRYTLAVLKERAGRGGSRQVHEKLRVGDVIQISAPRNHFALHEDAEQSVLLAGGIGITPIHAMLERLAELGRRAHLIYCGRSRADAAFVESIESLLLAHPGLTAQFHWDDEKGAPPDLTALFAPFASSAHYYCCGPAPMLDAFEKICAQRGCTHVHLERFAAIVPAASAAASGGYSVVLRKSGKTVQVPAGANLLDTLVEAGCSVQYSCHEGVCGACETAVLAGEVEHRDSILSAQERAASKSMMICVSGCRSAVLELDA